MFAQKRFLAAIVAAFAALLVLGGVAHATMPRATVELRSGADRVGERATVQRVAMRRHCRVEGGRRVCRTKRDSYPLTTRYGFATGGDPNIGPRPPVYRPGSLWTPTPTIYPRTTHFGFATGGHLRTFVHGAPPPPSARTGGGVTDTLRSVFPNSGIAPLRGPGSRSGSGPAGIGSGLSGGSHGGLGGGH